MSTGERWSRFPWAAISTAIASNTAQPARTSYCSTQTYRAADACTVRQATHRRFAVGAMESNCYCSASSQGSSLTALHAQACTPSRQAYLLNEFQIQDR